MSAAEDVFIPSQLPPILRLDRRNLPYVVFEMDRQDFLDYKSRAQKIRLRLTNVTMVNKDNVNVIRIKKAILMLYIRNCH